jgi:cell division protein FtsX
VTITGTSASTLVRCVEIFVDRRSVASIPRVRRSLKRVRGVDTAILITSKHRRAALEQLVGHVSPTLVSRLPLLVAVSVSDKKTVDDVSDVARRLEGVRVVAIRAISKPCPQ